MHYGNDCGFSSALALCIVGNIEADSVYKLISVFLQPDSAVFFLLRIVIRPPYCAAETH